MVKGMSSNPESTFDGLPPRNWRNWWLAWPKWFRVGCSAILAVIGLHVVLVLGISARLIYVRLAEPAEIQSLRRSGVRVLVNYEYKELGVPFFVNGTTQIRNAFKVRRNEDVHFVYFGNRPTTDADLELIARSFPNLTILSLRGEDYTAQSLRQICRCSKLEYLQLGEAELDLETIQQLLHLKKLYYHDRLGLYERKLDLASGENRSPTPPGTYEFTLDKYAYGAIRLNESPLNLPHTKTFYFRITEVQQFNAQLEYAGSEAVVLSFMGDDAAHTHRTRKNARQGDAMNISADITQADLEKLGDRCWKLKVANYSSNSDAKCKLTITFEDPHF